jgi:hypothetical protein
MPTERGQPLTYRPITLSDAVDGTNAPNGAMSLLTNLVPDPATRHVWVPRPAAEVEIDFTTSGFTEPIGFVSGMVVVGDTVYGMVATADTPGFDQPFAYDLDAGVFLTVSGVTANNIPASPPLTGEWTPPILAQVAGRVVVTHPGFPGGDIKFGWFDVSGQNSMINGTTINGQPYIYGNPSLLPVQPGNLITGAGIPASTIINGELLPVSGKTAPVAAEFTADSSTSTTLANVTGLFLHRVYTLGLTVSGPGIAEGTTVLDYTGGNTITLSLPTSSTVTGGTFTVEGYPTPSYVDGQVFLGGTTAGSAVVTIGNTSALFVGEQISSIGPISTGSVPLGSTILSIVANTSITLNNPASATGTLYFNVLGSIIKISDEATASADVVLTVVGGTTSAPLWGAGDTDANPLPSIPVGVAQMSGRAWFALEENGIVFSDSGFPCRVSNSLGVQALTTGDGLAVTAIGALQLNSLLGGITQSLIAFEGVAKMQQITGDPTTGNLAMNALPAATGTEAPLSICSTQRGLVFVSPEGLRLIDFQATVSKPIGDAGEGVTVPFINSAEPSRIAAASNADVVRISNPNGMTANTVNEEYWFDMSRQVWSGPHTSAASLIEPWRNTFLLTFADLIGGVPDKKAWRSDVVPTLASIYVERDALLAWAYRPTLLPDSGTGNMVTIIEMTLACQLAPDPNNVANVVAVSDFGDILDTTTVVGDSAGTIWGHFQWGGALWGALSGTYRQRAVDWNLPLVFRQASFIFTGQSFNNVRIGNLYMRYQILDYMLEEAS